MKSRNPSIFIRYLALLILIFSTPIIYKIFTPLTIYPTLAIIKLFINQTTLIQNTIILNQQTAIEIIPACIAASAYLLLLILNLSIPIKPIKRLYTLLLSFTLFLTLNILRISTLSILAYNNFPFFDITHKLLWYLGSTIFVIAIWFLTIKLFKIKTIPFYTDIKYLLRDIQ